MKFAVIKSGGKQYLVYENTELYVDKLSAEKDSGVEFETLALGDDEKNTIEIGMPTLKTQVKATVVESIKGDKVVTARFKAKARYRKVKGFRPQLTKVKIVSI